MSYRKYNEKKINDKYMLPFVDEKFDVKYIYLLFGCDFSISITRGQ